ncbi:hypothetical protein [Rahnella variigena]|uniref:hypothetical protein n=1 Tax=Rahnella variigena TaxID=574964 RepID=UPI0028DD1C56|nr:hypothetical protein [Rahnella variigena]
MAIQITWPECLDNDYTSLKAACPLAHHFVGDGQVDRQTSECKSSNSIAIRLLVANLEQRDPRNGDANLLKLHYDKLTVSGH